MVVELRVRYEDRKQAKASGARWNPARKVWYVVDRPSLMRCLKWAVLTPEARAWVADEVSSRRYYDAMQSYLKAKSSAENSGRVSVHRGDNPRP